MYNIRYLYTIGECQAMIGSACYLYHCTHSKALHQSAKPLVHPILFKLKFSTLG